ncbi:uncharacterized protein LOC141723310 [Apium graveolens]|uniref:uncharacterized protein LOC141723310 n=1 Tax=Apium graveolens TaxID=4045 RepID=UPI003D795A8F
MLPATISWLILNILLLLSDVNPVDATPPGLSRNSTCHDVCGSIPIRFPFGSGFGCGHPDFGRTIRCSSSGTLQFLTSTGIYTITSIDYSTNNLVLHDPFMSTCAAMQNSGSFCLDPITPFRFVEQDTFVLLGCSTTSPLFDANEDLCDTGSGLHMCRGLYSCKGVTGIGLEPNAPISTCCVYDPPFAVSTSVASIGVDLPKLQCSSYASIYGFGGDEGNPMKWQYGISLQYNDSYYSDETCKNCVTSGGMCGFSGLNQSFACICRNGMNTTSNCFGRGYAWNGSWRLKMQTITSVGGILISVMLCFP